MGKIDRQKELIGYMKVIFGILVAMDVSLVAWIFKHASELKSLYLYGSAFLVVLITVAIVLMNKAILIKIDELEEM
jgi:hypothetical protein